MAKKIIVVKTGALTDGAKTELKDADCIIVEVADPNDVRVFYDPKDCVPS